MKDYNEMASDALRRIREYQKNQKRKNKIVKKIAVPIMCFCLVAVSGIGLWKCQIRKTSVLHHENNSNDVEIEKQAPLEELIMITGFEYASEMSYQAPQNGEYFCHIPVQEARAKYINENVCFLLKIDFFSEENDVYRDVSEDEIREEYKRLSNEGYSFYKISYLDYQGTKCTEIVGKFTEQELREFKPNKSYGYTFRFISEDNNLDIEFEENNLVTSFDTIYE